MQLSLETHGQSVGDDFLDEFAPRNGSLAGGNFFEGGVLLFGRKGMDPGEKERANFCEPMFGDLLFGPFVVFQRADDEFDFVGGFQMGEVVGTIAGGFAGGGTFQVHDAANSGIHFGEVVRAAGFQEDGETGLAKLLHERQGIFLEQWFAAGQFNQGQRRAVERRGEFFDLCEDFGEEHLFALRESVGGVAIGAAEVAGSQPDKDAGQAGKSAFTLQADIDFVDDECVGHGVSVARAGRRVNLIVNLFVASMAWKLARKMVC